jgi:hypothetical protein
MTGIVQDFREACEEMLGYEQPITMKPMELPPRERNRKGQVSKPKTYRLQTGVPRILFLDINGVMRTRNCEASKWNRSCINGLKRIAAADANIKIVLTSSWRRDPNMLAKTRQLLRENALPQLEGATRILGNEHEKRGDEILDWLEQHGHRDTAWVALDDGKLRTTGAARQSVVDLHTVKTRKHEGLTMERAEYAIETLQRQEPQTAEGHDEGERKQRQWSYAECKAFPLHMHTHSTEGRGAGGIERERRALKWARWGYTHVRHVLDESGKKLLTASALKAKVPRAREDECRYILDAIPNEIANCLRGGRDDWRAGEWAKKGDVYAKIYSVRNADLLYTAHQLDRETGELIRQDLTIYKAKSQDLTRCAVWKLQPPKRKGQENGRKETEGRELGPPRVERDRGEEEGHKETRERIIWVADDMEHAPENPGHLAATWRGSLRRTRESLTLDEVGVCNYKRLVLDDGQIPRTFRTGGVHAHLLEGLDGDEKRQHVKKWMKLARHEALTRRDAERRYKIIVSGFYMGKHRRQGDERCCARCLASLQGMRRRGTTAHFFEDVRHAFHTCQLEVWKLVTKWWHGKTGQHLVADERTTLMGDRQRPESERSGTSFVDLEEPWVLLHAATLQVIWEERARTREKIASRSAGELWKQIRLRFTRDAQDHLRWVATQRMYMDEDMLFWLEKERKPLSVKHVYDVWQESGLGSVSLGGKVPFVLHKDPHRGAQR